MRTYFLAAVLTVALAAACAPHAEPQVDSLPSPAATPRAPVTASSNGGLAVTYLANEGFLVQRVGGGGLGPRVLVDALFGSGIGGYPVVPEVMRGELERGAGEWADVDLALASHFHGDHFDPEAVLRFLTANPEAHFVSTRQAVERLAALTEDSAVLDRARGLLPAEGAIETLEFGDVKVEILNLHHGRRQPPVENLGFVVHLQGARFVHLGDTEATMETFEPYLDTLREPEVALLPFWFLSSDWRAAMVRDRIRPERVVAAHVPTPDAPSGHFARWGSYDGLVAAMREAFPDARIPRVAGESVDLDPTN